MLIVADSGSTKTDWRIYNSSHGIQEIETSGLNPYFLNHQEIIAVLEKGLHPYIDRSKVNHVFFYGSGCSHNDKILEIESALSDFFNRAEIAVESDLLGSARALCGDMAGIVAILGTGSNSCVFNGSQIIHQILSLGYILGDEGSGTVLGKKVLKAAMSGKMPENLLLQFKKHYPFEPDFVLGKIYSEPFPNRFLASFAPFAIDFMKDEWMHKLIRDHLTDFFDQMITVYEDFQAYPLNLSGSIAWHLQAVIEDLCNEYKMNLGKVIMRPIEDLMNFHLHQDQAQR
jgi:glucosamine kinase